MKKNILILLILTTLTACSVAKEDKNITSDFLSGSYSKQFNELQLSGQDLTQIPNFKKYLTGSYIDNVWSIDLSNNNITTVNEDLFSYFPNLKEINLSYNQIENIKLELGFLQDLKIHKNKLTKVDLSGSKALKSVNIGYNELVSLNDVKLPKGVQTLELQSNKLENLNGIGELKNLETLKLEFNNLEDDDMKELSGLKKLNFISIMKNKLSKKLEQAFVEFNNKK